MRKTLYFFIAFICLCFFPLSCTLGGGVSENSESSNNSTSNITISGSFKIIVNPNSSINSSLIQKSIIIEEYIVTSLDITITNISTQTVVGSYRWIPSDGVKTFDVAILQYGEYFINVLQTAALNGNTITSIDSATVNIQPMIITSVNIIPGGSLVINVGADTAPQIVSVVPENNSINIPRNISTIVLTFDSDMKSSNSISFEGFNSSITTGITWLNSKTLEIKVYEFLKQNYQYKLTLNKSTSNPADYFRSTSNSLLAIDTLFTFTTDNIDLYFKDVRPLFGSPLDVTSSSLNENIIKSLKYNQNTVFHSSLQTLAQQIIEKSKNPGLGVKSLHQQNITGKNINVAIIDQNLASLTHPEYNGRVVSYRDFGCNQPATSGSMHGPAVLSLLAGKNLGTAPEANVYYAAVPSWLQDAQYYADALNWIIQQNSSLPAEQKIRVVSVSAAPSGTGSPFTQNNASWDVAVSNANNAGIIVLDCTSTYNIIQRCFYDINDPDNLSKCRAGAPNNQVGVYSNKILAPAGLRTQAEEYNAGVCSYQFTGVGGTSWTIPYVTGVLAMGFQLKPNLTNAQIVQLLFDTAYILPDGNKIINPVAFINAINAI